MKSPKLVLIEWVDAYHVDAWQFGAKPTADHTLDRIDNTKGYQPDNVRWATPTEQARNRDFCVQIDFQGQHFDSISHFVEWLAPQVNVNRKSLLREVQKCI